MEQIPFPTRYKRNSEVLVPLVPVASLLLALPLLVVLPEISPLWGAVLLVWGAAEGHRSSNPAVGASAIGAALAGFIVLLAGLSLLLNL